MRHGGTSARRLSPGGPGGGATVSDRDLRPRAGPSRARLSSSSWGFPRRNRAGAGRSPCCGGAGSSGASRSCSAADGGSARAGRCPAGSGGGSVHASGADRGGCPGQPGGGVHLDAGLLVVERPVALDFRALGCSAPAPCRLGAWRMDPAWPRMALGRRALAIAAASRYRFAG